MATIRWGMFRDGMFRVKGKEVNSDQSTTGQPIEPSSAWGAASIRQVDPPSGLFAVRKIIFFSADVYLRTVPEVPGASSRMDEQFWRPLRRQSMEGAAQDNPLDPSDKQPSYRVPLWPAAVFKKKKKKLLMSPRKPFRPDFQFHWTRWACRNKQLHA